MHFEFLVEGQVELIALSILMNRIIGEYNQPHTWKIHKHRGIGRIPDDLGAKPNKGDQTLLHNLPSKLRAYGAEGRDDVIVVVLVDLDERPDCKTFKNQLTGLLEYCPQKPEGLFRIAIEELEAWFLGDTQAIKKAYSGAKNEILDTYIQDSQCNTWEMLAEAIHPGGMNALSQYGKRSVKILEEKKVWATKICPHINVEENKSPSFRVFRDGIRRFLSE